MVMGPNNGKYNEITKDHKEAQRMREKNNRLDKQNKLKPYQKQVKRSKHSI